MTPQLSHNEQLMDTRFCQDLLFQFFDIMVIRTGKAFICRDYDRGDLPLVLWHLLPPVKILMFQFGKVAQDSRNLALQCVKVRLCILKLFLGLRQLGGRSYTSHS